MRLVNRLIVLLVFVGAIGCGSEPPPTKPTTDAKPAPTTPPPKGNPPMMN